MSKKRTSRFDYLAEVNLSRSEFVTVFSRVLEEKYRFTTEEAINADCDFFSTDSKRSLQRAFLRAIPAQLHWSVDEVGPAKCRMAMLFSLPSWLQFRLYCTIALLGLVLYCANHVVSMPVDDYKSVLVAVLVRGVGALVGVSAAISGLLFMANSSTLVLRYRKSADRLLKEICEELGLKAETACREIYVLPVRPTCDWKIVLIATGVILYSAGIISHEALDFFTDKHVSVVLLLIPAGLLLISVAWEALRGSYVKLRVLALSHSFIVSGFVIMALFVSPTAMRVGLRDLSAKLEAPPSKDSLVQHPLPVTKHTDSLRNSPQSSKELTFARACVVIFTICIVHCLLWAGSLYLLFLAFLFSDKERKPQLWDPKSGHQRLLVESYVIAAQSKTDERNTLLRQTAATKLIVWFMFFALSACCWAGILMNTSVVNAIVMPRLRVMPISDGETISRGATALATTLLGQDFPKWGIHLLRMFILAPVLVPFLLFIYLHLRHFVSSRRKLRSLEPVQADLFALVRNVASRMGVDDVSSLHDRNPSEIPFRARLGIWPSRKMVIFTENGIEFMRLYPEQGEAIIAHEISHLKNDCRKIRNLTILSRLGLVGAGFLSVLHDPVMMEERADNEARSYLRKSGKDESLLDEAISLARVHSCFTREPLGKDDRVDYESRDILNADSSSTSQDHMSLSQMVGRIFCDAYDFYFNVTAYDYIHREVKHRRPKGMWIHGT